MSMEDPVLCSLRGSTWSAFSATKRALLVDRAFNYWRSRGFPYFQVSKRQVRLEFARLIEKDWKSVFCARALCSSNVGLRLANSFQPEMWKAKVNRYKSPIEIFNDDLLLRAAIERSLRIWPDRFGANASCLRRMLRSYSGAASVSNYRPMIAKAVITRYCRPGGVVVDFSAGYGGRLLGALAANRTYFGIEPNRCQVSGYRRMVRSIAAAGFSLPAAKFLLGRAEDKLSSINSRNADLVFSSPPFFNWEHYSYSNSQSFRRYPRYELWKENFLLPVMIQSFRVLQRDGYLVLNVSNGNRLPSPDDVNACAHMAGFGRMSSYRMLFPKLPYLHPRDGRPLKSELMLVFRKLC